MVTLPPQQGELDVFQNGMQGGANFRGQENCPMGIRPTGVCPTTLVGQMPVGRMPVG